MTNIQLLIPLHTKVESPRRPTHPCQIQINYSCSWDRRCPISCSSRATASLKGAADAIQFWLLDGLNDPRGRVDANSLSLSPEAWCSHALPRWPQLPMASSPSVLGLHNVDFLREAALPLEMRSTHLGWPSCLNFSGIGCYIVGSSVF